MEWREGPACMVLRVEAKDVARVYRSRGVWRADVMTAAGHEGKQGFRDETEARRWAETLVVEMGV